MYFTPERDDKQIAKSESTVASYIASHKSSGGSGGGNKNATLSRKGDGTFEVVWKTGCIADFNKKGEASFLASTCDDTEIAASTKMLKDCIKKNGHRIRMRAAVTTGAHLAHFFPNLGEDGHMVPGLNGATSCAELPAVCSPLCLQRVEPLLKRHCPMRSPGPPGCRAPARAQRATRHRAAR